MLEHACNRIWVLLFLVVALPLMLMIAIAVKLDLRIMLITAIKGFIGSNAC